MCFFLFTSIIPVFEKKDSIEGSGSKPEETWYVLPVKIPNPF